MKRALDSICESLSRTMSLTRFQGALVATRIFIVRSLNYYATKPRRGENARVASVELVRPLLLSLAGTMSRDRYPGGSINARYSTIRDVTFVGLRLVFRQDVVICLRGICRRRCICFHLNRPAARRGSMLEAGLTKILDPNHRTDRRGRLRSEDQRHNGFDIQAYRIQQSDSRGFCLLIDQQLSCPSFSLRGQIQIVPARRKGKREASSIRVRSLAVRISHRLPSLLSPG